ncbi:MAG: HD-GYP domain-containing protein [Gammaproteobacteria bacterium]|nr:HD-GYP domain-containing protein [Gammaproteobacteria bacterium]MBU1655586.1 HD-GYP domain-containing protein [Gammaproteobacteria bacterium]MBU1961867.1 HD-GYP domain-containing protein [Gammaproteobacteria bacterium]
MPVKKIPSSEVEIGMFVSSLDRPWSETPFLFQGFLVREQRELQQLQEYAQHVYIMVPDDEIELLALPSDRTPTLTTTKVLHQRRYEIESDFEEEVLVSTTAHERVTLLVTEIEEIVRRDRELLGQRLAEPIHLMVDSIRRNPDAYVWLTRIKHFDSYLYRDALNSSVWAAVFGRKLGLPEKDLQSLATGAMLMDIGKTVLPVELLYKHPRLLPEEWELMKTHVQKGLEVLAQSRDLSPDVIAMVGTHHERLNGSGYPDSLKGSRIPLFGQMAGIIDFYVAVTTPRPFAKTISPSNAIQMLYEQRNRYFDETLVEQFIRVLGTYPTGSLVELSTGEVGIVVSQNPGLRLKPNVMLLLDPSKQPYPAQPIVSLINYSHAGDNRPITIHKTIHEGKYGLMIGDLSL